MGTRLASSEDGGGEVEDSAPEAAPPDSAGAGPGALYVTGAALIYAAPRFSTTRWSPSRRSTVFRSLAAISLTICSSRTPFIGLAGPVDFDGPAAGLLLFVFFLFN